MACMHASVVRIDDSVKLINDKFYGNISGRVAPLRGEPKWITRKQRSFADVVQTTKKHDDTLQPYSKSTVRRCTVSARIIISMVR